MNGLIGTTVERNEFKNVSIVILAYILDLPKFCTGKRIKKEERVLSKKLK